MSDYLLVRVADFTRHDDFVGYDITGFEFIRYDFIRDDSLGLHRSSMIVTDRFDVIPKPVRHRQIHYGRIVRAWQRFALDSERFRSMRSSRHGYNRWLTQMSAGLRVFKTQIVNTERPVAVHSYYQTTYPKRVIARVTV